MQHVHQVYPALGAENSSNQGRSPEVHQGLQSQGLPGAHNSAGRSGQARPGRGEQTLTVLPECPRLQGGVARPNPERLREVGQQKPTRKEPCHGAGTGSSSAWPPDGQVSEVSRASPRLLSGRQGRWPPRQQPRCDPGSFAPASRAPGSEVS